MGIHLISYILGGFKCKINKQRKKVYKARLVICGLKDLNEYDLTETDALVSRLALVRSFLTIVNAYNLKMSQMSKKPF